MRPAKQYPAAFRASVDRPGIEPESLPCQSGVFPLDDQPVDSDPYGDQTHLARVRVSHPDRLTNGP